MISEKIKKLREERGWTQIELAQKSGLSIAAIQKIEQGAWATNRSRRLIAWAFGLSISDIGGLGKGTETTKEKEEERIFREKLDGIFTEIIEDVSHEEASILTEPESWLGFTQILWILKRYGIKLPEGIL